MRDAPEEPEDFGPVDGALFVDIPITESWKRDVAKKLKAMGREQWELAEHIGCSQPNISQTLSLTKRKQKHSTFAHAISLAVKVPLPLEAVAALVQHQGTAEHGAAYGPIMLGLARTYGIKLVDPD